MTSWINSAQSLSRVRLCDLWTAGRQAFLSITNSWSLLKLMSIESVMPSNPLILYCSLLPPSIFSSIRVFSSESLLRIRWPKYWSVCVCIPSILSFLHCPYKHKIILSTSTKKSC